MCFDFNDSSVWDIEFESVNPTDSYDVVLAIIVPFYSYFFFWVLCKPLHQSLDHANRLKPGRAH